MINISYKIHKNKFSFIAVLSIIYQYIKNKTETPLNFFSNLSLKMNCKVHLLIIFYYSFALDIRISI